MEFQPFLDFSAQSIRADNNDNHFIEIRNSSHLKEMIKRICVHHDMCEMIPDEPLLSVPGQRGKRSSSWNSRHLVVFVSE